MKFNSWVIFLSLIFSINLFSTNIDDLLKYFPEEERGRAHVILNRVCQIEEGHKRIEGAPLDQVGVFQYPIAPETLEVLLSKAQGKNVIEFGGASGEISLLLLLAGANTVLLNDLHSPSLKEALEGLEKLPEKYQRKMKLKRGDCLQLSLKEIGARGSYYDIIIARNLIHLLEKDKLDQFTEAIFGLGSPGALINITAHTIHGSIKVNSSLSVEQKKELHQQFFDEGYVSFYRHTLNDPYFLRGCSVFSIYEPFSKEPSSLPLNKDLKFEIKLNGSKKNFLATLEKNIGGVEKARNSRSIYEFLKKIGHADIVPVEYSGHAQTFYTPKHISRLFDGKPINTLMRGYFYQTCHFHGDHEEALSDEEKVLAEVILEKNCVL